MRERVGVERVPQSCARLDVERVERRRRERVRDLTARRRVEPELVRRAGSGLERMQRDGERVAVTTTDCPRIEGKWRTVPATRSRSVPTGTWIASCPSLPASSASAGLTSAASGWSSVGCLSRQNASAASLTK